MPSFLLSPLPWALLLAGVLWLLWRRLGRGGRALGLGLIAIALALCAPLGANALVWLVESRTPAGLRCPAASPAPIVVLSGGYARAPRAVEDYAALNPASWRRLRTGVELWRQSPGATLVVAGGGPFAIRESDMLRRLARDWGVPADRVRAETGSTTTWETAFALRGRLPPRVRLVSSALHLPRALVAFRAAGFQPCAQPGESAYVGPGGIGYFMPQASSTAKTERAMHELVGLVAYRVRASRL